MRTKYYLMGTLALLLTAPAMAAEPLVGKVIQLTGNPAVQAAGSTGWVNLQASDGIRMNDRLSTRNGRVKIMLNDGTVLTLDTGTEMAINSHVYNPDAKQRQGTVSLFSGRIKALVSRFLGDSTVAVKTPTAVAGVRGTYFVVETVDEQKQTQGASAPMMTPDGQPMMTDAPDVVAQGGGWTRVVVLEGEVNLSNDSGQSIQLNASMSGGVGTGGIIEQARVLTKAEIKKVARSVEVRRSAGSSSAYTKASASGLRMQAKAVAESIMPAKTSEEPAETEGDSEVDLSDLQPEDVAVPPINLESYTPEGNAKLKFNFPGEK